MTYGHLRADCLYAGISSGPNARYRVWEAFTVTFLDSGTPDLPSTLQAVLFYLPTIIWHGLNSKAGVDADSILAAAHTFTGLEDVGGGDRMLRVLVRQIDRFLSSRRPVRQKHCSCAECVKDGCQLCGRR